MEQLTEYQKDKLINSWQLPEEGERLFSADNLIDAYFNGKKQGVEDYKALVLEKLHFNLEKSGELTFKCISEIKIKNFTPVSAKLRINTYKNYSVLIFVNKEDYINEGFIDIYQYSGNLEIENESEFFSIDFHFAYKGDCFNEKAVINDGYTINFSKI
jgi:hypothetical protein